MIGCIWQRKKLVSHPRKFKFYLDENFPAPAGEFLKALGHNVADGIKILKKSGVADQVHIIESTRRGTILLSFDRDFLIDAKYREMIRKSPGVILVEATDTKTVTTIKILNKILKSITENKMRGKILCASVDKMIYIEHSE